MTTFSGAQWRGTSVFDITVQVVTITLTQHGQSWICFRPGEYYPSYFHRMPTPGSNHAMLQTEHTKVTTLYFALVH